MSEETGVAEKVQEESIDKSSEATAAAAAFATNRGDTPPEPIAVVQPEEIQARDDQGRFAGKEEVTESAAPKLIAGKTEEEITALLNEIPAMKEGYRKQIDNLAGNFGAMKAAFARLQQDTPNGAAVEVTDEDMAEMAKDYGEFAGVQKTVLNNILKKLNVRGTASADPEAIKSLVTQGVSEVISARTVEEAEKNVRTLNRVEPDWRKIVGVPDENGIVPETEYRKWLATQPADYQQDIAASNNAFEIRESIREFQAFKAESLKKKENNRERLANNVQPSGTAAGVRSAISEQQAADLAFKQRRQRT